MKKVFAAFLSCVLVFSLVSCAGSNTENSSQSSNSETSSAPADNESSSAFSSDPSVALSEPESGKTLIAYFSWSGNTEQLAEMIGQETGGDLFEITPAAPYTDNYDDLLDLAQQEQRNNARPQLALQVENWNEYDTVFVGYPVWWSDAPMIILTFLESHDCDGKTIVPFCTSGGSGFGSSLSSIEDSAPGATILDGFHVNGSSVSGAQSDVASWIGGLGIDK